MVGVLHPCPAPDPRGDFKTPFQGPWTRHSSRHPSVLLDCSTAAQARAGRGPGVEFESLTCHFPIGPSRPPSPAKDRDVCPEHLLPEPDPQVMPAPSPPPLRTLRVSSVQLSVSGAGATRPWSWAGCHPRNRGAMVSLHGKQFMAQRTTPSRLSTDQPGAQLSGPVRIGRIRLERANLVKRSETQQPHMAYVIRRPLPARATFTLPPVS